MYGYDTIITVCCLELFRILPSYSLSPSLSLSLSSPLVSLSLYLSNISFRIMFFILLNVCLKFFSRPSIPWICGCFKFFATLTREKLYLQTRFLSFRSPMGHPLIYRNISSKLIYRSDRLISMNLEKTYVDILEEISILFYRN